MNRIRIALLSSTLCLLVSCSEPPREVKLAEPTAPPSSASSERQAPPLAPGAEKAPLPPTHPPIHGEVPKELAFKAPEGWVREAPTMMMRREQFRLPKQGTDTSDATVVVTVLGATDGGGVEQNLQRWASQWAQPDGSPSRERMKQLNRKLGPYDVIDLDLTGTYAVDETRMGGTKQYNEPNWRLLLSWIQSPSGNYYVKLVGPAATVAHWESSFRSFVNSAAP